MNNDQMKRLTYLTIKGCQATPGAFWTVQEAAASLILSHPEWDLIETKTFAEWEEEQGPAPDVLAPHPFNEDVADGSMCMCGVPAVSHHLVEQ